MEWKIGMRIDRRSAVEVPRRRRGEAGLSVSGHTDVGVGVGVPSGAEDPCFPGLILIGPSRVYLGHVPLT